MRKYGLLLVIIILISGCSRKNYQLIDLDEAGTSLPIETEQKTTLIIPQIETETEAVQDGAGQVREVSILIGGDILLSEYVLNAYRQAGGIEGVLDKGYRDKLNDADLFLANQEFPFSDRGTAAADKQFTFRLPAENVSMFQELGLSIVSLANNHALDYGRDALTDSIAALDSAGIAHIGAGENLEEAKAPVIKEINGVRVGFLGATRVIPVAGWAATGSTGGMLATYDPEELLDAIQSVRPDCDYLIVYVHWGIERDEIPAEYQRTLGKQYLDEGADLVVGSHPHVLQGIEYYNGKPIVYSLGNFIFGSSIPKTMLLWVDVRETDDGITAELSLLPGTSSAGYTSMLSDSAAWDSFYQYIEGISFGITFRGSGLIREVAEAD